MRLSLRYAIYSGIVLGLILLLVLYACSTRSAQSSIAPRPSATVTVAIATYVPTPVSGLLGPLPSNCPQKLPSATLSFSQGLQVTGGSYAGPVTFYGSAPVWLSSPPQSERFNLSGANPWPTDKLQFIVGPRYTGSVTITGGQLSTGEHLWFNTSGQVPPPSGVVYTSAVVYDLSSNQNQWTEIRAFPTYLHAGCYRLDVTAASSHWSMVYAVGR